ncbi:MAG: TonB-dependent receptor [Bacteroidota bacterium]
MMKKILFILLILFPLVVLSDKDEGTDKGDKKTISGYVKDNQTGEAMIGASVYIRSLTTGTITNVYGYYSLTVPAGNYEVVYSFLGYEDITKKVNIDKDIRQDVSLSPSVEQIAEVEVRGERKNEQIREIEMSTVKLPIKTIQKIPALMGEVDVIKSIQLLPGIQTAGEGTSGFFVRGGGVDQNLILLDDATVYNASHLGGFFSVFNQDAIKNVQIYKGGIPAQYGGRLSSLLDIRMKEGNSKEYECTGGIGTLSSRLTLEGPVLKDNSSFIVSARRTYIDLFFPMLKDTNIQKSKMYFYDLNTKINFELNDKNRIFASGYFGRDIARMGSEFLMNFGNATGTVRWNHLFSDRVFSNVTLVYSNFDYSLGTPEGVSAFEWKSNIIDYSAKADISYYLNPSNTIRFGGSSCYHTFKPGHAKGLGDESVFSDVNLPENFALESAVYLSNEQQISPLFSINYGLRFSVFQNIGNATFYNYDRSNGSEYRVMDTLLYKKGDVFNTYSGIEPRLGLRYQFSEFSSLKASYNRTFQYIHLASNTTASTPLDIWFPSTPNIKPQKADQVAIGYFRNLKQNTFETSFELYYKKMYNAIDFRDHASLLLNPYIEGEIRTGDAYSYGAEFMVKKQEGRLTGWISYTLSKTRRIFPDINDGKEYAAPYDKPHDISVVLSYDLTPRLNLSANWVYSTGMPATMPTGRFEYQGMIVPVYSDRNAIRMPDYHRMDLACTWNLGKNEDAKPRRNGKPERKYESSLNFSIYNLYNRHNAYSINFRQNRDNPNVTEAEKFYLFKIVPSITYNFKF